MNIFLAGASGFAGSRVLDDLVSAGHDVVALAHSERSLEEIARSNPKAKAVKGDVANADDMLRAVPIGMDAIIYLPGLLREFPSKGITFRKVHVDGVKNLLAAAKQSGATRWIQMSALGASQNGSTGYFRTKWEAEELVRASGLDWTILRPSLIFDDRQRHQHNFVDEIAKAIRMSPLVPILGDGKFLFQPVSLDDVSQTIVQSLSKPETIGKIYEIGGPEKITYIELVTRIAQAINSKKPPVQIPLLLISSFARLFGPFSWFPITEDQILMIKDGNYVHDPIEDKKWQETFKLPMKKFSIETIKQSLLLEQHG